jgi:hypothetical protein
MATPIFATLIFLFADFASRVSLGSGISLGVRKLSASSPL